MAERVGKLPVLVSQPGSADLTRHLSGVNATLQPVLHRSDRVPRNVRSIHASRRHSSLTKHGHQEVPPFWRSPAGLALLAALAAAAFYLLTEHTAHVFGVLPYVLVLACPLMHFFMHRGHRHGARQEPGPGSVDHEHRGL